MPNENVEMWLVDKTGLARQESLAPPLLPQYFIRSDITKEWADR